MLAKITKCPKIRRFKTAFFFMRFRCDEDGERNMAKMSISLQSGELFRDLG